MLIMYPTPYNISFRYSSNCIGFKFNIVKLVADVQDCRKDWVFCKITTIFF